ncbi:MAG TPA: protein kinase [Gemmatimonadaceae bacterium]|jgi:serine/threonine-protein kinase
MTASLTRLTDALADRYTIERELSGGGMSRVFVATETALDRSVVIKVIAPALLEGMSAERFAREVRLAARLQQANIVPVLAAGDANGLPYYTMPFVRGESLRSRLVRGEPVPIGDAVHILRDIARALAYAHGEGVVHRDIKPDNVLLSGGAAVVTDFGIAKAIDVSRTHDGARTDALNFTLTQAGTSLGTPAYMAPEQAAGDPRSDHRADIYAWGIIAWELLARRHPFAGKPSVQAIIVAQMSETPPPLVTVRSDVPKALSDLVQHCLQKDPDLRPASATEILASLDQMTTTGSGAAATRSAMTRRRRFRTVAGIAGLVVLAAAIGWAAKWHAGAATIRQSGDESLAVIPFASLSSDTSNAYLGEGIAEEVANTLTRVPGLRLAGQASSARFAVAKADPQVAGKSLNVAAILNGTVQRSRDRIRVSAELSNVSDGAVVWQESYERDAKDIFAVQDDIARAIAGQLQVTLAGTGRGAAHGTADPTAYDLYLRGMYLYRRRGPGITGAINALDQATVRDSAFARAWAALSVALLVSPSYVATRSGAVIPRALAAAERAVRLDPTLSDAHLALGYADAELFKWPDAEAELRRAIALDPGAVEPRYRLAYALVNQCRDAEAIPVLQLAVARDPLYFMTALYLGRAEVAVGRTAEGLDELRRALALEPQSVSPVSAMASAFAQAGFPDSARLYAHRLLAMQPDVGRIGVAAFALARAGAPAETRAIIKRLEAGPTDQWERWTALAMAYAGLRDTARTVDALRHAAAGDGDGFPEYGPHLACNLPSGAAIDAVRRRYHLEETHAPASVAATAR